MKTYSPKIRRILIVDDSMVVRDALTKQLLKMMDVEIVHAGDGQEGLKKALTEHFDLIITDVEMPCKNGLEMCRLIKDDPSRHHIPVIILSVLDDENDIDQGFLAGADAYLSKNEAREKILQTIEKLLYKTTFQRDQTILVVDDSSTILSIVRKGLSEAGFTVVTAENGRKGLDALRTTLPSLILSDIDMPEMDGLSFCQAVHADPLTAAIPFVVMSANNQRPIMRRMLQLGADSYLVKPFNLDQLVITVEKLLSDKLLLLHKEKERLETERSLMLASITSLSCALEARDSYTQGHSEAVAEIAVGMARLMNFTTQEIEIIHLGATLHDIGKIGVMDQVLLKPGKLTDAEYDMIKRHPVVGADILRPVPSLAAIIPMVLHHHERIDGKGYPDGLKGDAIPLWARMIAIGDTFHALTSDRPYRKGMPLEKALQIIEEAKGTQLCPECIPIFLQFLECWHNEKREGVDGWGGIAALS
ncbi:MAG: response regulator [Deltaproteobacteria bacterium]|nr:response regulator [Candidatus Anaeroferrophillus wilburensis]MBN2888310.1 response regulator [Deltaproteobacteria bacterium]